MISGGILRGILYTVLRTKQLDDSELFLTLFQQPFEVLKSMYVKSHWLYMYMDAYYIHCVGFNYTG